MVRTASGRGMAVGRLLLVVVGVGAVAAVAEAAGGVEDVGGAVRPVAVIPFMKTAPKIDGVIADGEWATLHVGRLVSNAKGGLVQPRRAEFWLGSDGKRIYLAMRSAVHPTAGAIGDSRPERFKQDAGRRYGGIFGFVQEDYLDLHVDNRPGAGTGTYYRLAVNPLAAVYDTCYDHRVNISTNAWRAKLQQAHKVEGGFWTAELAIEPASMDIADLRQTLAVRVGREFAAPKDYCRWEQPALNADFPGQIFLPDEMPRVRFADAAPIVSEAGLQDGDGVCVALDLTNPTAKPMPLKARLGTGPQGEPLEYKDQDVTLPPGATRRVEVRKPLAKPDDYVAEAAVRVSRTDGEVVYQRGYRWHTRPDPDTLWEPVPPKAAPAVELRISYQPTARLLRWRADWTGKDGRQKVRGVRVAVVRQGADKPLVETKVADAKGFACERRVALPALADGVYEARLYLDEAAPAAAPAAVEAFHHQGEFPWTGSDIGISDEVIPPFTPLTVKGATVGAILREHDMTDTGLWAQVRSQGRAILAAPMRLEVRRGGKVLPVKAKLKFAETKPHRVVAGSAWSAGPLNGRTTNEFDYDGAAKVTLDLAPTGGEVVDALDLVIPLKDVEAPLMHVCADGLRFNYGGIVPAGEGTVWTSKAASRGNLIGTFVPYVFVGGEERGLVWFASNDADWVVDVSERTPA
ncbi:MAG TPA: glycoside hydrolase domain-containing protein, partial [Phycisphaerae bacterium]|nr:glycoside hydrolase domain-containing protein [Phycisphaerae bacterium]